jgi:arabinofuranosyltransferase
MDAVGFSGYFAGPGTHIIDIYALGDPLLARLPAMPTFRVGHFERRIPDGYDETVARGVNKISDPDLAAYYDRLHLIVAGPIFSRARLWTTAGMLLGRYDQDLRRYADRGRARTALPTKWPD